MKVVAIVKATELLLENVELALAPAVGDRKGRIRV